MKNGINITGNDKLYDAVIEIAKSNTQLALALQKAAPNHVMITNCMFQGTETGVKVSTESDSPTEPITDDPTEDEVLEDDLDEYYE